MAAPAAVGSTPACTGRLVKNLSVPAVKSRLHRARLMMRDALTGHYEERLQ